MYVYPKAMCCPYISQFKDTIYFINNEKLYNLSVSIGYSRFHEKYSKSIDDIICRADEKMYKDKKKTKENKSKENTHSI